MTPRRPPANSPARMKRADHARLWRAIEGAVVDAAKSHPEYYTDAARKDMVGSVTKRAVGAVLSLAPETREGGRASGCLLCSHSHCDKARCGS
jgi:hypothetical protein